ncbi:MAG TPA: phosphodiesterase, partial [Myxococcaceae bacterium]|nr:phosphodiesterase [Myxococcaceae bacterium]
MPEQPTESAPGGRAAFRGLSPVGPAARRLSGAVVNAALLLLVSGVGAFVISPTLYPQQIPEFSRDDIGKPFHSTSPTGFKAGRDYQLVNQALTEHRRQEARSAVRPVYDYNPALVGELRASVHEAFAGMRDFLAHLEQESAQNAQGSSSPDQESIASKKKRRPESAAVDDELLASRLWAERRSFEHKLFPMEDEDFHALVAARFPLKAELAAISLIERAYHAPVATLRDELSQWGGQGITVRSLGSGGEHVSSVAPPIVNDVQETKAELDRFASIPGYFLSDSPSPLRRAVLRLVKRQIRPNLTVNIAETEARRSQASAAVKDVLIQVKKGQKVISDGELIDDSHLAIFDAMRAHSDRRDFFEIQLGGAGLIALLVAAAYAFHRAAFRPFRPSRKDALLLASLLIATLWLIRLAVAGADALHDKFARIPAEALYYAIPVAAGAMLVRFL